MASEIRTPKYPRKGPGGASMVDCTITLTSAGSPGAANAVGTFSATLTANGGGPITITNGVLNTPVTAG
jgi:hypothetical protein